MRSIIRLTVICFATAALLTGCGSDSGKEQVISSNTQWTMAANSSVLVPAGSTVTSPNGTSIVINGSDNTVYTEAGATVAVPATATGPANNHVSTGQATSGATATSKATVSLIAGSATTNLSPVDGTGTGAVFWGGGHLALDPAGDILVSDQGAVRQVTPAGVVTTLTSNTPAFIGIACDRYGNIYGTSTSVASYAPVVFGATISERSAGTVLNYVNNWETSPTNPSLGSSALAVDASGTLYLADTANYRIVKFTSGGAMSVLAGNGTPGNKDGMGSSATFRGPTDLAVDGSGNLYVTDAGGDGTSAIRKVTPDGTVSTMATFPYPMGPIAVTASGVVYTTGFLPLTLLRLDARGNTATIPLPYTGDGISALVADRSGSLYAGTRGNGAQILKISFDR